MALALTEPGADRNVAGIETTAQTIRRLGREALPTARDVIDTDHIDHVFATMDHEFGRVDCWPRSWSGRG